MPDSLAKWDDKPVELNSLDEAQLKQLVKSNTERLLLIALGGKVLYQTQQPIELGEVRAIVDFLGRTYAPRVKN